MKVAIIVREGSFNNLVLLSTLIAGLAGAEARVRVLFRDEALLKLTKERVGTINFSPAFAGLEDEALERLQTSGFSDLETYLRHAKELGDVKYFGCRSSLYMAGIEEGDLIAEIDEVMGVSRFIMEELADAEKVLTF